MKKNSMAEKLAAGVRQAKQQTTVSVAASPSTPIATPSVMAPAKAPPPVAHAPAKTSNQHYAQQEDQRPASSLDDLWANLHPQRIWPD